MSITAKEEGKQMVDDDVKCVNAHDRCYGGAGGPCPYCERPIVAPQQVGIPEGAPGRMTVATYDDYFVDATTGEVAG